MRCSSPQGGIRAGTLTSSRNLRSSRFSAWQQLRRMAWSVQSSPRPEGGSRQLACAGNWLAQASDLRGEPSPRKEMPGPPPGRPNARGRLVEMHGGSVVAESDGPGRGSRFTVRCGCSRWKGHTTVEQVPDHSKGRMPVRVWVTRPSGRGWTLQRHSDFGPPARPWIDVVDVCPHPPHHPGMDRRRFLLTSLAGTVGGPLATGQLGPNGGEEMRNRGSRQNLEGWLRSKTAPAPPMPKPARPPRRPPPRRPAPPKPRS
jgi:hypothetical protein